VKSKSETRVNTKAKSTVKKVTPLSNKSKSVKSSKTFIGGFNEENNDKVKDIIDSIKLRFNPYKVYQEYEEEGPKEDINKYDEYVSNFFINQHLEMEGKSIEFFASQVKLSFFDFDRLMIEYILVNEKMYDLFSSLNYIEVCKFKNKRLSPSNMILSEMKKVRFEAMNEYANRKYEELMKRLTMK
jgi:hypothetical protein